MSPIVLNLFVGIEGMYILVNNLIHFEFVIASENF